MQNSAQRTASCVRKGAQQQRTQCAYVWGGVTLAVQNLLKGFFLIRWLPVGDKKMLVGGPWKDT